MGLTESEWTYSLSSCLTLWPAQVTSVLWPCLGYVPGDFCWPAVLWVWLTPSESPRLSLSCPVSQISVEPSLDSDLDCESLTVCVIRRGHSGELRASGDGLMALWLPCLFSIYYTVICSSNWDIKATIKYCSLFHGIGIQKGLAWISLLCYLIDALWDDFLLRAWHSGKVAGFLI